MVLREGALFLFRKETKHSTGTRSIPDVEIRIQIYSSSSSVGIVVVHRTHLHQVSHRKPYNVAAAIHVTWSFLRRECEYNTKIASIEEFFAKPSGLLVIITLLS